MMTVTGPVGADLLIFWAFIGSDLQFKVKTTTKFEKIFSASLSGPPSLSLK